MSDLTDQVRADLAAAGAPLGAERLNAAYHIEAPAGQPALSTPLVSCLMVSRGDPAQARWAVQSYASQTWADRELVVVTAAAAAEPLQALLKSFDLQRYTIIGIDGLPLGDLRNLAAARATGEVLIQWDDDDLADPARIELALRVLIHSGADVAFMARWLLWWPERELAAISQRRHAWEGSLAVRRAHAPLYPALPAHEDRAAYEQLWARARMVTYDAPLHYVYAVHGRNTWDAEHFKRLFDKAEVRFEGAAYHALNQLLAERMPVLEYEAYLKGR